MFIMAGEVQVPRWAPNSRASPSDAAAAGAAAGEQGNRSMCVYNTSVRV